MQGWNALEKVEQEAFTNPGFSQCLYAKKVHICDLH